MKLPTIRRPALASPLAPFVDSFWIHGCCSRGHSRERVLPTGTASLVFAIDADGRTRSSLVGPRSMFVELETSRPFRAIGVHFKPGGVAPFFGVPSSELRNLSVTLDLVWGRLAASLSDRLWGVDSEEPFDVLERVFVEKSGNRFVHPAVQRGIDAFEQSFGRRSVNAVADQIGISSRRFQDIFRSQVGISPKRFYQIRRFAAVLQHVERVTEPNWADIGLSCGYFDQAHFNHDFRTFSGITPSTYLRDRTSRTHVVTPAER